MIRRARGTRPRRAGGARRIGCDALAVARVVHLRAGGSRARPRRRALRGAAHALERIGRGAPRGIRIARRGRSLRGVAGAVRTMRGTLRAGRSRLMSGNAPLGARTSRAPRPRRSPPSATTLVLPEFSVLSHDLPLRKRIPSAPCAALRMRTPACGLFAHNRKTPPQRGA